MLTRICLILAIIAGLGVVGMNFGVIKPERDKLRVDLKDQTDGRTQAEQKLASTSRELETTKKDRDQAKAEIAGAIEERDKATAEVDNQTKRANALNEQLAKTKADLSDKDAELAQWTAIGLKPEQIKVIQNDLRQTQGQLVTANEKNVQNTAQITLLNKKLESILGVEEKFVPLPQDLQGKVLVSDPKWDFVVLNIGERQGVLEDGILLVNRDGKLVAKVKVRSVQADRSIANVLPNWKLGEVMEGDSVIP